LDGEKIKCSLIICIYIYICIYIKLHIERDRQTDIQTSKHKVGERDEGRRRERETNIGWI